MSDEPIARREALLRAAAGAAGLGLTGAAAAQTPPSRPAAAAEKGKGQPRPGWAHRDGKIALKPNGAGGVRLDPMDHILIQQAFARYAIAFDEGQGAVLASMFTEDAVVETAKGSGTPMQRVVGHQAVIDNFPKTVAQLSDQRRHCITNVVVESLTRTTALALAYCVVPAAADGLWLGASVFYRGELRKESGVWRFNYLFIGIDAFASKPSGS